MAYGGVSGSQGSWCASQNKSQRAAWGRRAKRPEAGPRGLEVEVRGAEAGREPGDIPGGGPEKRAYMLGSGVPNALRRR